MDSYLAQLYDETPRDTLFVVATQGAVGAVKQAMGRKQRCRWAARDGHMHLAGSRAPDWTDEDEDRLVRLGAHALSGAAFLRFKT